MATAIPLVGASVAQAAMAGANVLQTTSRPDLVSASQNASGGATFCFDKPITAIADLGGFYVGGYKADKTSKSTNATVPSGTPNCVNANVSNDPRYSFAQVGEGAVRTTGNITNRADSIALSTSVTNNGTIGRTTAPDLIGISIVPGAVQQIAFRFDEPVSGSAIVAAGGFHFVTSVSPPTCPVTVPGCDVASQTAAISTVDPSVVIVQFPVGGNTPLVTNAVRGYVVPGAVTSGINNGTPDGWDSSPNAGSTSGVITGIPTLLSANYSRVAGTANVGTGATPIPCGTVGSTNCVVVDYTFNEAVSVNNLALTLSSFYAYLSNGSYVNPVAVTEPSGTNPAVGVYTGSFTVRAFYQVPGAPPGAAVTGADARGFDEYLVKAGVSGATTTTGLTGIATSSAAGCDAGLVTASDTCAVVSTTTGRPNTVGSAPIGGNNGGHAAGFSTAPEAFSTQFDTHTNTVSVQLDQRTFAPSFASPAPVPLVFSSAQEAANFQLLDANGNEIAGATGISSCSPSTVGFPCALPIDEATAGIPGSTTVWVIYPSPAVQVGNAKGLEIRGQLGAVHALGFGAIGGDVFAQNPTNTVVNPIDPFDAGNVQQILSPTTIAAHTLRSGGKQWSHKRMTTARLHSVLRHTKHQSKHRSKKH